MMSAGASHPLRAAREAVGWTRPELALASGMSASMIKRVELGEKGPSQRTAEAFELALLRRACSQLDAIQDAIGACARLDQAVAGSGNGRVRV